MGRKRQVVLDQDEDIVSYEHNLAGKFVRVLVGIGSNLPDGEFAVAESQTYETYIIQDADYVDLMAGKGDKPAKTFRRSDLWQYVDSARLKKNV